jgi:Ca2+-transporting ATPase
MGVGTLLVLDAGLPGGFIEGDRGIEEARTMAFHTLVLFQIVGVLSMRSDTRSLVHELFANRWLWLSIAFALAMQALVLYVPALQAAFRTVPLHAADWALCAAVACTLVIARELQKVWWRRADGNAAPVAA